MKRLTKMVVASLVMMSMVTGCSNNDAQEDPGKGKSVKIGMNFELSGDYAEYGSAEANGVLLAFKLASEREDAVNTYELVKLDNKSSIEETTSVATKLAAQENVSVILGPAVSGLTMTSYPIGEEYNVAIISPSATADKATLKDDGSVYNYGYRVCFTDSFQGTAMAVFAKENLNASKAVILGDSSSDYAKGLADNFKAKFEANGGEIVAHESYQEKDTDFNTILTKIKDLDFDVIYIPGYYNEVGLIIKQARAIGIDVPVVGGDGFDSPTLIDLAGASALNDVYFTTAYTTVDQSEKAAEFVAAYKAEYGTEPSMFAALGYDAANLAMQVIEELGTDDPKAVNEALSNLTNFDGVTGSFKFDEYHNPIKSVMVVELVDGVQASAIEVQP